MDERERLQTFIVEYFSDEEVEQLAFHLYSAAKNQYTRGMLKSTKVLLLIEDCEKNRRLPELHFALRRQRSTAYDAAFPNGNQIYTAKAPPEPPKHDPKQIFISHAHQDADFANKLAQDLEQAGWKIWIAPKSIAYGEDWVDAIERGLAGSGIFLLIISPDAVGSEWVRSETNIAIGLEHQKRIKLIPLNYKKAQAPLFWTKNQTISFRQDYGAGWQSLLYTLDPSRPRVVPSVPTPKPRRLRWLEWLRRLPPMAWAGGAGILALVLLLIFWPDGGFGADEVTSTDAAVAQATSTITPTATSTPPTATLTSTQTATPTITLTPTATPDPNIPPADAELGDTWTRPKDGMVMVYVPPPDAPFVLESGVDAPTEGFWIDKYEVSNAQYQLCVDAGACEPAKYIDDDDYNGAEYPVVGVSAFDAEAYSEWVGGELPTEGQWEYTAVGDSGFDYPWGDEFDGTLLNCAESECGDGYEFTSPVNNFLDGASWVGALNMSGNVWEWTASWYDEDETRRVLRGGSWFNARSLARAAYRSPLSPVLLNNDVGFRVVVRRSPSHLGP